MMSCYCVLLSVLSCYPLLLSMMSCYSLLLSIMLSCNSLCLSLSMLSCYPLLLSTMLSCYYELWNAGEEELKLFLAHLNESHPTIKFTATYDFATRAVPFLDTVVSIGDDGYIKTNLYIKPGTKCTYLSPTSSQPNFIAKNIPFSLAYRLLRICSDPRDLTYHLRVLKQKLTMRGYRPKIISAAFKKIREIPREKALMKVSKTKVDRICLPIPYDLHYRPGWWLNTIDTLQLLYLYHYYTFTFTIPLPLLYLYHYYTFTFTIPLPLLYLYLYLTLHYHTLTIPLP